MLILSAAVGFSQATALKKYPGQIKVLFHDGFAITAQTAQTYEEHEKGLMFRKSLAFDAGMLFVFEREENRVFWMKNTLIPLDIVWLDTEGKIVFMRENALPCREEPCESYSSEKPAMHVLEVNGNLTSKWGVKEGSAAGIIR